MPRLWPDEWEARACSYDAPRGKGGEGPLLGSHPLTDQPCPGVGCDAFLARESAGPLREPSLSLPIPTELYVTLQEVDAPTEPRASHKKQTIYIYIYIYVV